MKKIAGMLLAAVMAASVLGACTNASAATESGSESQIGGASSRSESRSEDAASKSESRSQNAASRSESKSEDAASKSQAKEEDAEKAMLKDNTEIKDLLDKLTKNEYPELAITAEVDENKDIRPGSAVKVTVTVKNNGDQTLVYEQGSGVFETPQAVFLRVDNLQPVIPKDHLGVATADFHNKELKPGEEKKFDLHLMAIKPNDEFATMTHDVFDSENKYIVDWEWDALQKKYPSLEQAAAGTYNGEAYFTYYVLKDGGKVDATAQPTGYAQADFSLTVAE